MMSYLQWQLVGGMRIPMETIAAGLVRLKATADEPVKMMEGVVITHPNYGK